MAGLTVDDECVASSAPFCRAFPKLDSSEGLVISVSDEVRGAADRRRGQSGSVILFVMGILVLLTFGLLAIVAMTQTTLRVSVKLEETAQTVHALDSSMEHAANIARNHKDLCTGATGPEQLVSIGHNNQYEDEFESDFDVFCDKSSGSIEYPDSRNVDLTAQDSTSQPVGMVRARIEDGDGSDESGYRIVVCDWVLTADLINRVGTLDDCPPMED